MGLKNNVCLIFWVFVVLVRGQFVDKEKRIDCHPDPGENPGNCVARGCTSTSDWVGRMG